MSTFSLHDVYLLGSVLPLQSDEIHGAVWYMGSGFYPSLEVLGSVLEVPLLSVFFSLALPSSTSPSFAPFVLSKLIQRLDSSYEVSAVFARRSLGVTANVGISSKRFYGKSNS